MINVILPAVHVCCCLQVDAAFGRGGIPSYVLEGVLGELQAAAGRHLAQLATGMSLELTATSMRRSAAAATAGRSRNRKDSNQGSGKGRRTTTAVSQAGHNW